MRGTREVKTSSYVSPRTVDLTLDVLMVKAFLVPSSFEVLSSILPPSQVLMDFFDELSGNLDSNPELLVLAETVLTRNVDHAEKESNPQQLDSLGVVSVLFVVHQVINNIVVDLWKLGNVEL